MSLNFTNKLSPLTTQLKEFSSITDLLDTDKGQDIYKTFSEITKGNSVSQTAESLSKLNINPSFSEELLTAGIESKNLSGTLDDVSKSMENFQSKSSSALGGLGTLVASHPIATIGTAAVAAIGIAYSAYKNYKQNMINEATEGASAWEAQNSTLEAQKQKYIELKKLLDSGVLDESGTYDVKMQILDIQNQIVGAYGDAASELDLVNGQLSNQLSLLGDISQTEARKNLVHNRKAYKDAEKEMTTEREYQLGHLGLDPQAGGVTKDIYSIAEKHEKDGIALRDDGTGVYTIHFEGDASQAQEAIESFMLDTDELLTKYKDDENATSFIEGILSSSEKAYRENEEILDNYADNYKEFLKMTMIAEGNGENSPATIYGNFAQAVDQYNEAIAEGDSSKIDEATTALENAQETKCLRLSMYIQKKYPVDNMISFIFSCYVQSIFTLPTTTHRKD